MQSKEDYSYGVIPAIKEDGVWKIFLIDQYGHTGGSYWSFPKGHPDENETKAETALRELSEETAMTLTEMDSKTVVSEYDFMDKDILIQKRVEFFIGYVADTAYKLCDKEVKEGRWCTYEQARTLATYGNVKEIIDEVEEYLESKAD